MKTIKSENNQISLFEGKNRLKIEKPIRLIELFAGIGAQAKALENLGIKFEHYRICEFDKYKVCSKTRLYKQAGNSIVVDVLMAIFKNLL